MMINMMNNTIQCMASNKVVLLSAAVVSRALLSMGDILRTIS